MKDCLQNQRKIRKEGNPKHKFLSVIWRSLINAIPGALAGLLIALVYNAVAGMMGGVKLNIE